MVSGPDTSLPSLGVFYRGRSGQSGTPGPRDEEDALQAAQALSGAVGTLDSGAVAIREDIFCKAWKTTARNAGRPYFRRPYKPRWGVCGRGGGVCLGGYLCDRPRNKRKKHEGSRRGAHTKPQSTQVRRWRIRLGALPFSGTIKLNSLYMSSLCLSRLYSLTK